MEFDKVTKQIHDKKLPRCIGKLTYQHYIKARNCLYRNLCLITLPFGGSQHGHLGMIMPTVKYLNIASSAWQVPPSQPAVSVIPAGATPDQRSTIFNHWSINKKGIMYADHVTRHVRNLNTTPSPEEFYIDLHDAAFQYDNVHLREIRKHILENSARLDDNKIKATRQAIYESPDFNKPIDVYFNQQEKIQDILEDAFFTVDNDKLVRALQKHAASTGMLNSAYIKWTKKRRLDRGWTEAKKYFRKALVDVKAFNKITSGVSA